MNLQYTTFLQNSDPIFQIMFVYVLVSLKLFYNFIPTFIAYQPIMQIQFFKNLLVFAVLFLFTDCRSEIDEIPDVYVNFEIDLTSGEFAHLQSVGNSLMVTGGYKGIIIYHQTNGNFAAYERACPYNPYKERVSLHESFSIAVDSVCQSRFSLSLEGRVLDGPSPLPLKMYRTFYNGASQTLLVFN